MKKLLFFSLLLFCCQVFAQKIVYTVDGNGTHIQGVDGTNPVIFDNDMTVDSPELWYLWLKANRKQLNLVGNVSTKDGHPQGYSHDHTYKQWTDAYNAFTAMGGKNVPAPVRGSSRTLNNGQTAWETSVGSDLIISEAKKASSAKPLVIFVGGQCTSVANAFLKDRSIGPNIIVFHIAGWQGSTGTYNTSDKWSAQVLLDGGVRYVNWCGNLNSWYNQAGSPMYSGSNKMPGITLNGMPSNNFSNMLRVNWFNQAFAQWGDIGDAPATLWFFNNALWRNVVRKNSANQTVTDNNFYFLLVSDNNWNAYGPQLNSMLVDPTSYIPDTGTTTPPPTQNQPPIVNVTNGTQFTAGTIPLSANASDPDGSITKVEFYSNGSKVGETSTAPYVYNWGASAGSYQITAAATDNLGARTTSTAVTINVTSIVIPPQPGNVSGLYNVMDYGAKGDGVTDDQPAFQAATEQAIINHGKVIIPPPRNFYRLARTWQIGDSSPTQIWIDVEMWGSRRGNGIIYYGPSNQPAIQVIGAKNGIYQGLQVKVADGLTGVDVVSIGTWGQANSTAGLIFIECNLELNDGINNKGFVLGKIENNTNGNDISQITFMSCAVWGKQVQGSLPLISGQVGYLNAGNNTLQITWIGGGFTFIETGVDIQKAGSVYFYGMGTSHVKTVMNVAWANLFTINGGRFEFGEKFLKVNSGGMPIVTIQGAPQTEDFRPGADGRFIEFNAAGTLILDGLKINRTDNVSFDSRAITLGGNGGAFFMRGGAVKVMTGEFFTATSGWRINIQDVARLDADHKIAGWFTNRRTP